MLFLGFGLCVLFYSPYVACTPHDNLFLNTQTFPWLCLFCVLCLRRVGLLSPPVAILSIHLNTNSSGMLLHVPQVRKDCFVLCVPMACCPSCVFWSYLSSQLYPMYCTRLCLTLYHKTCLLMQCPLQMGFQRPNDGSKQNLFPPQTS